MNHLPRLAAAVLAAGTAALPITPLRSVDAFAAGVDAGVAAGTAPGNPGAAVYDGETLDLSESWATARACAELGSSTECYDTEAELLAAHPEFQAVVELGGKGDAVSLLLAECSSSLRLYDGTSYAGSVLYLTTRGLVLNLSSYGFDNVTSSRRNGACAATLYSSANAGGSSLAIASNSQAASMPSGWNNVASSVYIS